MRLAGMMFPGNGAPVRILQRRADLRNFRFASQPTGRQRSATGSQPESLVIAQEEQLVAGPAASVIRTVPLEGTLLRAVAPKAYDRVEHVVAEELEHGAVIGVRAAFGCDTDLAEFTAHLGRNTPVCTLIPAAHRLTAPKDVRVKFTSVLLMPSVVIPFVTAAPIETC
jgi:hypothetical protein